MNTGLDIKNIQNINAVFASFPEIEKAVLFGSRAKGTQREGSDIDICLVGNKLDLSVINAITQSIDHLNLPYLFDIIIWHRVSSDALLDHISRVGIVLFEKQAFSTVSNKR